MSKSRTIVSITDIMINTRTQFRLLAQKKWSIHAKTNQKAKSFLKENSVNRLYVTRLYC
jgi:hypothetical protein